MDLNKFFVAKKLLAKYFFFSQASLKQILIDYINTFIKNLKYKPIILCTGAALSFFTGMQAPINRFIDNFYLGWLLRIIFNPIKNFPRTFFSIQLFIIILKSKIKVKSIII